MESFKHFKNVTQTKEAEFNSCQQRYHNYMHLLANVKDGHLDICPNFATDKTKCECHEYLYMTPIRLIKEIVDTIAVSYIINFEHVKQAVFEDSSCTVCLD